MEKQFPSWVAYIRYSIGENHYGDPAIFFRIVLRDEAATDVRRRKYVHEILRALMNEIETYGNGLDPQFDFVTVSEQQRFNDPHYPPFRY